MRSSAKKRVENRLRRFLHDLSFPEIQLLETSADPLGRGLLSFLAGYFCSLCTFEWSLLWDFAPYEFRPSVAAMLTLGFMVALIFHGMPRERRPATPMTALTLLAVLAWPLRLSPITTTVVFSVLVLVVLLATLHPGRAGLGLLLALGAALAILSGIWTWPLAALACVLAATEVRLLGLVGRAASGPAAKQRLEADAETRTAEISWKGFAALFKAAAPGEGERFTTTVLADTNTIIEGCGGRRIKGSDLNGVYRFPNQVAVDRCLSQLQRYEESIADVLKSTNAPPLRLVLVPASQPESLA